jgi:hypothetical protein
MTKVRFPPVYLNYNLRSKKQAKQKAISFLMSRINDPEILSEIKVELSKKEKGIKTR